MSPSGTGAVDGGDGARHRVVAATGNPGKLAELQTILSDHLDVEVVAMTELGIESPPEDGDTFEANALLKARACAAATGLPALADDSGLEVDALGGAPGVRSARYAGEPADDAANNAKLVAALADVPPEERTARFVCAAAIALPDGREHVLRGTMDGRIVDDARGTHGFGYDPHFVSDRVGDGRTNAELTPDEKHAISHRGAAVRALAPVVRELLAG